MSTLTRLLSRRVKRLEATSPNSLTCEVARGHWKSGGELGWLHDNEVEAARHVRRVFVDGAEVKNVFRCRRSWALAYDDGEGNVRPTADHRDIQTKFYPGRVEIEWQDGVRT